MPSDTTSPPQFMSTALPTEEFGFSATDPLLGSQVFAQPSSGKTLALDDDIAIPGMMDAIHAVGLKPELLPMYIRGGYFALDKVLKFLNDSGTGFDIITPEIGRRDAYPFMFGPDWLVKFIIYFTGFTQKSIEAARTWIPVSEIHCPDLDGCSTDFEFSTTTKDQGNFKVTALGFSGGSGYSKTITNISGGRISQKSVQLQSRAEVRLRVFENSAGEHIYTLDVATIFDETRYVQIDASDFYNVPFDTIMNDQNLRAVSSDISLDELSETLIIEEGKKHSFSWSTKIPGLLGGMVAALSVESQIKSNAVFKYMFAPNYRYVFYPMQVDSHIYFVLFQSIGVSDSK